MEYKPLTIDADAVARQELQRLETAFAKAGDRMSPTAFEAMVALRKKLEPDYPAAKVISSREGTTSIFDRLRGN